MDNVLVALPTALFFAVMIGLLVRESLRARRDRERDRADVRRRFDV